MAGPGQPQGKALSGEEEIVQSLLEGINTVAYPKAFVTRKMPKAAKIRVSVAAVEEAMASAGVGGRTVEVAGAGAATEPNNETSGEERILFFFFIGLFTCVSHGNHTAVLGRTV